MNVGSFLAQLRQLELDLAKDYRAVGERHDAEHDVYHQCLSFAAQCERHAAALTPHVARYGENVDEDDTDPDLWRGLLERVRHASSEAAARSPKSGLLLLRDLRFLFLGADETSITWVMAGQAAQAARDLELLTTVTSSHTETELQVKWLTTRIKVAAPQALVVG
jgi:hypothetical protein